METANKHGPRRSPIVLLKPSAASAYAEAHCAIDNSEAPEHTIKIIAIQNNGVLKRADIPIPSSSSTRYSIGQVTKL